MVEVISWNSLQRRNCSDLSSLSKWGAAIPGFNWGNEEGDLREGWLEWVEEQVMLCIPREEPLRHLG